MELFSLSQAQMRIWYSQKKYKEFPLYNIGGTVEIMGTPDFKLLRCAIEHVYWNNTALHLRLCERDNHVKQYVSNEKIFVDMVDFSAREVPEKAFLEWCEKQIAEPFRMTAECLCYFAVFKVNEKRSGYFIKMHHILADGWSVKLLTDQVKAAYEQLVHGRKVEGLPKPSYLEYVKHEEQYLISEAFKIAKEYWKSRVCSLPESTWKDIEIEDIRGNRKTFFLNNEMQKKVMEYLKKTQLSIHTFFIGIMLIYEYKRSGRESTVLGIPLLGRTGRVERQTFGTFTNTMPYRYDVHQNETVYSMMKRIAISMHNSFKHQKYPYNLLQRELEPAEKRGGSLYHTCINYYNTVISTEIDGLKAINTEYYNGYQDYLLQIIIRHWNESNLQLDFDYQKKMYTDQEIEDMFQMFEILIDQVLYNDQTPIKGLLLVNYKERNRLLFECNQTQNRYPYTKSVIDLFCEAAEKYPNQVAITKGQEYIYYSELNLLSDKVAQSLLKWGICSGNRVVVIPEYTIESIAVILGIMKCEAVYIPLDIQAPKERIEMIVEKTEAKCLIVGNRKLATKVKVFCIADLLHGSSVETKITWSRTQKIAYTIYTSGSTGIPKGVQVTHRNLVNYLYWAAKTYIKLEKEVFPLFSSFAFDFTVTSMFLPLVTGNEIRLYDSKEHINVLKNILEEGRATILKITPSQVSLINDAIRKSSTLHTIIFGGEELRTEICKELRCRYGKDVNIYNEYGPTETTVGCMTYKYSDENNSLSVPIGKPIDNTQVYVLDKDKNPQPINMVGEIYVGGDGVAAGYHDSAVETKKSFIKDTIRGSGILYKTGDLAFRNSENNLVYCGRIDRQIKIRGYRVELREIEERILRSGFVKQVYVKSVVMHEETNALCAYIVGMKEDDESKLKKYLSEFLPEYMIPIFYILIEQFPMNENGKLDAVNLPYPAKKSKAAAFQPKKEFILLVEAMKAVLSESVFSSDKNFYEMGGDSIKAILVSSYLYEKGYNLSSGDILTHPSLFQMAEYISERPTVICKQGMAKGYIEETYMVSWFLNRGFVQAGYYNQSILLEWKQPSSFSFLDQVMRQLIRHHDGLRMNIDKERKKLFYNNRHLKERRILNLIKVSDREFSLEKIIEQKTNPTFDVCTDLLFRPYLILSGNQKYIYIILHHLITDSISMRILLEDLTQLFMQQSDMENFCLPKKTSSYQEYAQMYSKAFPAISNNVDILVQKERRSFCRYKETKIDYFYISEEQTAILCGRANEPYLTKPQELLMAAVGITLAKLLGRTSILVEVENHGRDLIKEVNINRTIGWFTFTNLVELEIVSEDIDRQLGKVKDQIRRYLKKENRIFQTGGDIRFNYLGEFKEYENEVFALKNIMLSENVGPENQFDYLVDFNAFLWKNRMYIHVRHISEIKDFSIIMQNMLQKILEVCEEKQNMRVYTPGDFDLVDLTPEELDLLL